MTLQAVAGFLGQSGIQHPANLYRNLVAGLAGQRSGFFRMNDFAFTPNGSAMSANVNRGDAMLLGTEAVTTQGGYYVWNNATETLAWPASTTLPRIDSLILRVIDTDYGADPAGSKATWEIVSGTPAASPAAVADSAFAPAGAFYHPGAWMRVLNVQVPALATNLAAGTITHMHRYARLGRHTMAAEGAFPTDPQIGDTVTQIGGTLAGTLFHYNGTLWQHASAPSFVDYTPTYYSDITSGATGITMSTLYSRVWKFGRLVTMIGSASYVSGASASGFGISLPHNPAFRHINAGSIYVTGTSPSTSQTMHGAMMAASPWNRVTPTNITNSFQGMATGQSVHWNLTYEAAL